MMPRVNPDILRWARNTAGLSLEQAAKKVGIRDTKSMSGAERVASLEKGLAAPTRPQLKNMAKAYRRPLIAFYMSSPPKLGQRGQDFRTLPATYSEVAEPLLDALIRDVRARQDLVRVVLTDEDEAEHLPFVNSMDMAHGVDAVIASIRDQLGLDVEQFWKQSNPGDAFKLLRSRVEELGVFVLLIGNLGSHHTDIPPQIFRGFALADPIAPFIVINDKDSRAAWSFTLLHELAHIWLGHTGISNNSVDHAVEKFCNEVAAEFLLPKRELDEFQVVETHDTRAMMKQITTFAKKKNLSSSMVAYRLFLAGVLSKDEWRRVADNYKELWLQKQRENKSDGAPTYYTVRQHRVGDKLIELMHRVMRSGGITTVKAGKVLGVKATGVHKLIEANGLTGSSRLR